MMKKKIKMMQKYIKKNLIKNYIHSLIFLIRFSVFFVFKSYKNLKLYIDYKKLNVIIIKNYYTLFLIQKMQNQIKKIK